MSHAFTGYATLESKREDEMPDKEGKQSGPGVKDTPDQAYKSGRAEDVQEGSLGAATGGADVQKSRLPEGSDEAGTTQSGGFAGQEADDSPDAGTVGSASGEGDSSPHAGSEKTPEASADDVDRMEDAPDQQDAAPGAATDSQGFGQHGDQDATDTETKQPHPATPSDMGSR
jgi:hypothetical protein